jgi:hypothetical protein
MYVLKIRKTKHGMGSIQRFFNSIVLFCGLSFSAKGVITKIFEHHSQKGTTLPFWRPSKGGEFKHRDVRQLYHSNSSSFIWRLVDSPPLEGCPKGGVVIPAKGKNSRSKRSNLDGQRNV